MHKVTGYKNRMEAETGGKAEEEQPRELAGQRGIEAYR